MFARCGKLELPKWDEGETMHAKRLASLSALAAVASLLAFSAPATAAGPECNDEFVGLAEPLSHKEGWAEKENWSDKEIPLPSQFACIGESWGVPVVINLANLPNPVEVKGLNDQSPARLEISQNTLLVTDPAKSSIIKNLRLDGQGRVQAAAGAELGIGGGSLGGSSTAELQGPGSMEIPKGAFVETTERGPGLTDGVHLFVRGTFDLGEGSLEVSSGSELINAKKMTMSGAPLVIVGGNGEIANEKTGTILASRNLVLRPTFVNHGKVTVSKNKLFHPHIHKRRNVHH